MLLVNTYFIPFLSNGNIYKIWPTGKLMVVFSNIGSFTAYATRFFSPSYGFALSWNYWFNDAVSVASDLTAAQLVLNYWTDQHTWIISLVFLVFLLIINATSVHSYGEMGTSAPFFNKLTLSRLTSP